MVLVIMQHAYLSADMQSIPFLIDLLIWKTTYLAAIAFVSISGVMYSYFIYLQPDWTHAYRKYATKNALLILAAHPIINIASLPFHLAGNSDY